MTWEQSRLVSRREALRVLGWGSLGLVVGVAAACTQAAPTAPASGQAAPAAQTAAAEVNIAALFPLTGDLARPGEQSLNAAKLGADDINAGGGIKALGGAKLNVISSDLRSDDTVTRAETERILTTNKITAVNGCYASALTLVASEVTERQKVPIVTGSITNPLIERGFKYIFQVSPRASQFGSEQVKLAQQVAGDQKRVAVVFENTAFGTSTSKGVQDEASKAGLEVALFEPYDKSFTDAGPLVNKIKAADPGVLFPISYPNDFALIIRTLKQQNVKMPIIAGGAGPLFPEFGKTFGSDADGVFSVCAWNKDISPDAVEINKRYTARYNEFVHEYAGEAYAFMWIIADALERAKSAEPDAVRDALASTNLSSGLAAALPSGKVQFDERGWNSSNFPVGVEWQQGDLVSVYPSQLAKAKIVKPA